MDGSSKRKRLSSNVIDAKNCPVTCEQLSRQCGHTATEVYPYDKQRLPSQDWSFVPNDKLLDHRIYKLATTPNGAKRFGTEQLIVCGACIKQSRCQRCQSIGSRRSSICANCDHRYCQECLREMPSVFGHIRRPAAFASLPGYNTNACHRFGGPSCWLCFVPGTAVVVPGTPLFELHMKALVEVLHLFFSGRPSLPTALQKIIGRLLLPTNREELPFTECEMRTSSRPSCPCHLAPSYCPRSPTYHPNIPDNVL
jgi:hypothetical protein